MCVGPGQTGGHGDPRFFRTRPKYSGKLCCREAARSIDRGKSRWEPGLVHRLDLETSGLVLVAKTEAAFDDLRLQFRRRQVKKRYWALVRGVTEAQGSVGYPIAHDSRNRKRMRIITDISRRSKGRKSWPALTRFRKLREVDGLSLLEMEMRTGVTHQIRVHLAATDIPLLEILYGAKDREKFGLKRHFLHACWSRIFPPSGSPNCQTRV